MPRPTGERDLLIDPMMQKVREYKRIKDQKKDLDARAKVLRDDLMEHLSSVGEQDEEGHLWLDLPQEVEGKVAMQAMRKVSFGLDEETAIEILLNSGLDHCLVQKTEVDQDAVFEALENGDLTAAEVDLMFPKTVSWAFYLR